MSQPDDNTPPPVLAAASSSFDADTGRASARVEDEAGPGRVAGRQFKSGEARIEDVKFTAAENPIAAGDNGAMALSGDLPAEGGVSNLHQNVRPRLFTPLAVGSLLWKFALTRARGARLSACIYPQANSKISRHATEKKLVEAASGGTDPYVVAYLGRIRDKRTQTVRTESVVADPMNDNGRNPVWSSAHCRTEAGVPTDNVLHIAPGAEDIHLTLELWDSDIDADDFLGGRTLKLDDLRQQLMRTGGSVTMHIQLFDQDGNEGFEYGHDAGVLQVLASFETNTPKGSEVGTGQIIRIEVQAAVDLLPDTPPIRDLTTFSDWRDTIRFGIGLAAYLVLGTVYYGWFFGKFGCTSAGTIECTVETPAVLATDNVTGAVTVTTAAVYSYPVDNGNPFMDALLFMLGSTTTVGWGSQPVNFAEAPLESSRSDAAWFAITKVLLSLQIIIGIMILGLLVGSLGASFRSWFRKQDQLMYGGLALTPLVGTPAVGEIPSVETKEVGVCGSLHHHHIAIILLFCCLFFGSGMYMWLEDLGFVDAFYLTVVSVSTVGYGDFAPSTFGAKAFSLLFVPVGVAFVANSIDNISTKITQKREDQLERFVLGQFGDDKASLDDNDLTAFDFEELQRATMVKYGEPLSRNDFRLAMLLRLGRVEHDDMKLIDQVFETLDPDSSGYVQQEEVVGQQDGAMVKRMARLQSRWAEARDSDVFDSSVSET